MNIVIYSDDPKIESKILKVDGRRWKFPKYIRYDDEDLPRIIYNYAFYYLKKRWLEAEEYILKEPHYACWYAINIIRGKWPEAEKVIKSNLLYYRIMANWNNI